MTFLGLEQPVAYGRELVFDPTTANMVLQALNAYINAARDEYLRGIQEMKDFNKEYGDFLSPILKDMDWYEKNVTGDIRNFINDLYAHGIDPLRSAEGRAAVSRKLALVPTEKIAKVRQSAEVAKEYVKNYGTLDAAGKLDPAYEKFLLNGRSLSDWDTINDGMWGRYSPAEAKTLQEYVHPTFENIKPHMMSKEDVESRGYKYDPNYEYTGITKSDMEKSLGGWLPGVRNEGLYKYYREQAKEDLIRRGNMNPTEAEIDKQFVENAITADALMMTPLAREANQFRLDDYRTNNDIRAHSAKAAIDHKYWKLQHQGDDQTETGYNIPEDVYVTSLAKAAGENLLPKSGVNPNLLQQLIKEATKRQNDAILKTHDVLSATGMFISPEKISGLIQSDGKTGDGYFLNSGYFKNLHELSDIRTSYKGWMKTGSTLEYSNSVRKANKLKSKNVVSGIRDWNKKNKESGFRVKVVSVPDENGNNIYGMVGDDGRWHTYVRVRVYMNDGKKNVDGGAYSEKDMKRDIPQEGRLMGLEVGLLSNRNAGTPDLSVDARENLGFYGFDATKEKIGLTGNTGWPYGNNILQH